MVGLKTAGLATLAALTLGVVTGYLMCSRRADERAAADNTRAKVIEALLAEAEVRVDSVLAKHREAQHTIDSLVVAGRYAARRYFESPGRVVDVPREVPDTCAPLMEIIGQQQESLHLADFAIRTQQEAIDSLTRDNTRLADELENTSDDLRKAKDEMAQQAKRTEHAPRRWLGFIPLPEVTVGGGVQYSGGKFRTGPQINVGWSISL